MQMGCMVHTNTFECFDITWLTSEMKFFFGLILSAIIFSILVTVSAVFDKYFYGRAFPGVVHTTTLTLVAVYILVWLYKRKKRRKKYEQHNGLFSKN